MGATHRLTHAVRGRVGAHASARAVAGHPPAPLHLAAAIALAATLALALAIGAFAVISLSASHSETLESVWWLAAFGLVTPVAAAAAERLLAGTTTPGGRAALTSAAAGALVLLCTSLFVARAAGALPWSLLLVPAVPLVLLALRRRALLTDLARVPPERAQAIGAVAVAAAVCLGVAAFLPADTRDPVVIVRAVVLLAVAAAAAVVVRRRPPGRRVRVALGVVVPLALALLAWDVSFQSLTDHQDFYLGPVNDIRHGRYMLVDDYSQYGVGVIYFLAAILAPLPFGYGTFVLALGVLTAVMLGTIYAVLRVATRSLAFAALGTFVALMASSIATLGRGTQYPSTSFLRFGIPWLLVCALVVAYRRERPARTPLLAAYALVGASAVWSFETAFYTVATFVVSVLAVAATQSEPQRLRCALGHLAAGAGAAALAIAVLVAATFAGRGSFPQVGGYLDFLRLYSVSGFGQLPIPGWSLGFLMGALYAVSLAAIWVIAAHARGSALGRPSAIVPLAAVTTFGAVSLTYFLGRSHPNNLTHIAPPFVVMLTLWTALAWRAWVAERVPAAAAAAALAVACCALLIAQQTPQLADKAPDSALAAVAGGGLPHDLRALADLPVISSRAPIVEALVRRSVPRGAPLLVAVEPGVGAETLIRLDRSHALPIGTPEQDAISPLRQQALLLGAARLPCGVYVVTQDARMSASSGRALLEALVKVLRQRHPFRQVAGASGYRVFRLGC